jgi:hypothetical protein
MGAPEGGAVPVQVDEGQNVVLITFPLVKLFRVGVAGGGRKETLN